MRLRIWTILGALLLMGVALMWWGSQPNTRARDALARNLYWEALAAGEPEMSTRLIGYITANRARHNRRYWGGGNIYDVVYARNQRKSGKWTCQFSWTCMKMRDQEPDNKELWLLAQHYAQEQLAGGFVPPEKFRDATNYLNKRASVRRNVCEFKTELVYIGRADLDSQHEFYREPKDAAERSALPKRADVPECHPPHKPVAKKKPASKST